MDTFKEDLDKNLGKRNVYEYTNFQIHWSILLINTRRLRKKYLGSTITVS